MFEWVRTEFDKKMGSLSDACRINVTRTPWIGYTLTDAFDSCRESLNWLSGLNMRMLEELSASAEPISMQDWFTELNIELSNLEYSLMHVANLQDWASFNEDAHATDNFYLIDDWIFDSAAEA